MTLFKGELTLEEILYSLPKKRLLELRDARAERLMEEQRSVEKMQKDQEREANRQKILHPEDM